MNFQRTFRLFAIRYGQQIAVYDKDGNLVGQGSGFVQPITTENKDYLWQAQSPLGSYDGSQFRLLGEAGLMEEARGADHLLCRGQEYNIQTLQPVTLSGDRVYWWGILTLRDKEDGCYEAQ